ncbi:hypothetical protein HRI_002866200 [Hibiscus trionum]|uniref:Uncharacterized protein n=1 Tax=Hibiscus trionum TaxID=183268 RepID=A0A9W7M933_HIBTR|nr:hypothetical protein HRI_002866200 [Hibiscus trionum]
MEHLMNGYVSPPSSPPSPLPISVGPDNKSYSFSPSPPTSSRASVENLPLLHRNSMSTPAQITSAFSLDRKAPDEPEEDQSSCLKDLLEWLVQKCCS